MRPSKTPLFKFPIHIPSAGCEQVLSNLPRWWIQRRDPGSPHGSPPIFLDQTEARRTEKFFWRPGLPLSKGLDDRPPPPPPAYLKVWIRHCPFPFTKRPRVSFLHLPLPRRVLKLKTMSRLRYPSFEIHSYR